MWPEFSRTLRGTPFFELGFEAGFDFAAFGAAAFAGLASGAFGGDALFVALGAGFAAFAGFGFVAFGGDAFFEDAFALALGAAFFGPAFFGAALDAVFFFEVPEEALSAFGAVFFVFVFLVAFI